MADILEDPPEFTDDELRAALKQMGEEARTAAFAIGRPIMVLKDGQLVLLCPDGSKIAVGRIDIDSPVGNSQ